MFHKTWGKFGKINCVRAETWFEAPCSEILILQNVRGFARGVRIKVNTWRKITAETVIQLSLHLLWVSGKPSPDVWLYLKQLLSYFCSAIFCSQTYFRSADTEGWKALRNSHVWAIMGRWSEPLCMPSKSNASYLSPQKLQQRAQ